MRFSEWIDKEVVRLRISRTEVMRRLSDRLDASGQHVSIATLSSLDRGAKISLYWRAKAIQEATGRRVTITELCE